MMQALNLLHESLDESNGIFEFELIFKGNIIRVVWYHNLWEIIFKILIASPIFTKDGNSLTSISDLTNSIALTDNMRTTICHYVQKHAKNYHNL